MEFAKLWRDEGGEKSLCDKDGSFGDLQDEETLQVREGKRARRCEEVSRCEGIANEWMHNARLGWHIEDE